MIGIPIVEDLLTLNVLLNDIDVADGKIIGELAWRSVQKYENTVRLLRYNNHVCYVNNINAAFQTFAALNVTLFQTDPSIGSEIILNAVKEWKMSIRETYNKSEKLSLTNWTLSVSSTRVNENSSKT